MERGVHGGSEAAAPAGVQGADFVAEHLAIFACPACGGDLQPGPVAIRCAGCGTDYPITDGIPQLFAPNDWQGGKGDVTATIRQFYEQHPFPNYDDFDNVASLLEKARRGVFAKLLDDQVPFGARVLEAGCGTGQLTNFLSVANRTVFGADLCLNSLRLGKRFRDHSDLKRAHFLQMNLFRPCFRRNSFDLVVSNGVLHHTSDPELGFAGLSELVRPGGYIVIGLYHRYGRLFTDFRRLVFRLTRDSFRFLDRRLLDAGLNEPRKRAWFMDQYKNPHESKHTVGQVLHWLARTGLEPVGSIPKATFGAGFSENEKLFRPSRLGGWLERALVELSWAVTQYQDGGFFMVIARKPKTAPAQA